MKEVIAWLTEMVICICRFFVFGFLRWIIIDVIIVVSPSRVVVASIILVVCTRPVWILCIVVALAPSVVQVWVNGTLISGLGTLSLVLSLRVILSTLRLSAHIIAVRVILVIAILIRFAIASMVASGVALVGVLLVITLVGLLVI